MDRTKSLVTHHTRAAIMRHLFQGEGTHTLTRHGVKMTFTLTAQPTLDGQRIEWRARIGKTWEQGKAGTVTDAIREIERIAAR